jgi:hypothetical protein
MSVLIHDVFAFSKQILLAMLWSALLPPDPHSLPHWSGRGFTLFDWFPHLRPIPLGFVIALTMEAASTSETSVNFSQTTRCNNP